MTIRERSREAQRLEKVLEDACVKLSVVATNILGVSGMAMLAALIDGERDPDVLAEMARQRLRAKHDALVEALTGRFDEHHAFLCQIILRRMDELTVVIEKVTGRIDTELAPLHDTVEHLVTIPGVDRKAAAVIIAETGGHEPVRHRRAPGILGRRVSPAATSPAVSASSVRSGRETSRSAEH